MSKVKADLIAHLVLLCLLTFSLGRVTDVHFARGGTIILLIRFEHLT